jgi:hypothetical protein
MAKTQNPLTEKPATDKPAPKGHIFDKETGMTFKECQAIWNSGKTPQGNKK